jgi:hypothetical protein
MESGACVWQAVEYAPGSDSGRGSSSNNSNSNSNSSSNSSILDDYLTAGSAVRLFQPELGVFLVGNCHTSPSQVFGGGSQGSAYTRHNSVTVDAASGVLEIDPPVFAYDTRNGNDDAHAFVEDALGHAVFIIEKSHPLVGGRLEWGEPVRFHHVASNSYLSANLASRLIGKDSSSSKPNFKAPFAASLCRLIDSSDEVTNAQFLQDTVFFLESTARLSDDDDKKIKLPMGNLCIRHVYRQSEYMPSDLADSVAFTATSHLPYFMRIRRRVEGEVRKLRADIFDGKAKDYVIETILSFGDDAVLKIPQYPEIIASGTSDALSEVEREQRVSELADKYTSVSKVAMFLDDVNDADVIALLPVSDADLANTATSLTLSRILHEFEVVLLILASKLKAGVKHHLKPDQIYLMHSAMDEMTYYSSSDETKLSAPGGAVAAEPGVATSLETAYDRLVAIRKQQLHVMDLGELYILC